MRTSRSTKRLNDIIHKENSPLGKLFRKSEFLLQLNNEIACFLPNSLSSQCQVANINRTELILHVRSAALLTRLRLMQKPLLHQINQRYAWANIEKLSVKVRPIRKSAEPHPKSELSRSQFIVNTIEETASHCHDKDLKIALLNLASHIQKPID